MYINVFTKVTVYKLISIYKKLQLFPSSGSEIKGENVQKRWHSATSSKSRAISWFGKPFLGEILFFLCHMNRDIRFPIIERFRKYWGNYGIGKMIMTQTMVPSYSALSEASCRGSHNAAYTHLIENRSSSGVSYTAKFWNVKMKNDHECFAIHVYS